jgi:AraC family transcriptional regulator
MTNRELMLTASEIMESNLSENLSIVDIADQIGFSSFYFTRLFKVVTGFSPKQYYLGRRLTESLNALLNTDKKIIDIALDFGFGSPEVYARTFLKQFEMTPSEARKGKSINMKLMVTQISNEFIDRHNHAIDKEPEIVELDDILLIGIQFYYDLSLKNDLSSPWQLLMDNLELIQHKKKPMKFYQLQYWFEDPMSDSLFFHAAIEVDDISNIPMAMTAKTIPKQKYLKFRHKGKANEVGYTYDYIYNEWLLNTDYKLPGRFNFEYYGEDYLGPYNDESISEIYIPLELKE